MKNIISITVLLLTLIITPAYADPTVTIKAGGWPGAVSSRNAGVTHGFIYSVESTECNTCFSANIIRLRTSDASNLGIGADYVFKALKSDKGALLRFTFGVARFEDRLNGGERNNAHIGAAFEMPLDSRTKFVISYDHYSNGRTLFNRSDVDLNIPSNMLSLGFRFQ